MGNIKCSDIDIVGYLEGVKISNAAQLHISQCEICRQEIEDIRAVSSLLEGYSRKEREKCPSSETITQYAFSELRDEESKKIKMHLDACDECKSDVEILENILEKTEGIEVPERSELPSEIKKKLRRMRMESLSHRLRNAADALKAKGDAGIEKIKEIIDSAKSDALPMAASPDDITKTKDEKDKEEIDESEDDGED